MMVIKTDMQQFRVKTGAAEFDCLFCTREAPFVLALTSRGLNPKLLKFEVERGYRITEYLGEMYGLLLEMLRVDGRSGQPLKPGTFLKQLDSAIPKTAKLGAIPSSVQIVRLRSDIEDCDKPYFDQWIYWQGKENGGKGGPTEKNRHKTLMIEGKDALAYSVQHRASSKWSATPTEKNWRS